MVVRVRISNCFLRFLEWNLVTFWHKLSVAFLKGYRTNLKGVINSKGTERREREWHFTEEVTFELAPAGWVGLCQKRGRGGPSISKGKEVRAEAPGHEGALTLREAVCSLCGFATRNPSQWIILELAGKRIRIESQEKLKILISDFALVSIL